MEFTEWRVPRVQETGDQALRVLALVEEPFSASGTGKPVLEFARQAARADVGAPPVHVTMLTFARHKENEFIATARAEGFPLEIVWERGRFDQSIVEQLRAAVDRCRPDVLWTNSVKSHFLVRVAALNQKVRWVAFHHGYTAKNWVDRAYSQLDRWSLRGADRVVTVCQAFADQLHRRNGVARQRIRIQHVPVRAAAPSSSSELVRLRQELGLARERVVLAVGRLSKEKGHADFLHALVELRRLDPALPIRALIVGDGLERHRLEGLCCALKLADTVQFVGHQGRVQPYYELADVFVLPSHSEGTPNVLLEAMASNLPVICTRVGGVPELATDDVNALMVPMQNPGMMARAIHRVLNDPALASRLARSARSVVEGHSSEHFFCSIRSVFRER